MNRTSAALLFIVSLLLIAPARLPAEEKPELWLFCPTNLAVNENIDKLQDLWKRAAAAGYTRIMLADSKFGHLDHVPDHYLDHCKKTRKILDDLHLKVVPAVFSIGYSNDMLENDPNLAEGMGVKDTPFIVDGETARCVQDPAVKFGKVSFKDDSVKIDGNTATVSASEGNHRMVYSLELGSHRCYHVSVMAKTQDFTGHPEIKAMSGDGRELQYEFLGIQKTQDWKRVDVVFTTLDDGKANVYFGDWEPTKGTLWWKDWKIEEVGLVNVIRREGAPVTVTSEDGKTTYVEGKDYDKIVDPKMGRIPYNGEYHPWNDPVAIHVHGIPSGAKLRVSWYYPPIVYDGQVAACISEPQTMQLLADEAKRMKEIWQADGYAMEHDEFRVCNQDESCQKRHLTPGQMLAENIRACTKMLQPQTAYVWNDMFDPYHNAVKGPYYLVNGPWTGSWEGLSPDVVVMNWNFGKRDESLKFFADRGNKQVIAGFYDADLSDFKAWLASAAKVKGVVGYMYTTWQQDYSKIEDFAKVARGQ